MWFPFSIKQTAGIVMIDLQQLWPAHRNDTLENIGWCFARLRRVPAVWCSKYNPFYMTSIKLQTVGWKRFQPNLYVLHIGMTITILSEWPCEIGQQIPLNFPPWGMQFPPLFLPYDVSSQMTIWPSFRNDGEKWPSFSKAAQEIEAPAPPIFYPVEKVE